MSYQDLRTHLKIRMQEAQMVANQQLEAVALAISAVLSDPKDKSSGRKGNSGPQNDEPKSAAEIQQGLSGLFR